MIEQSVRRRDCTQTLGTGLGHELSFPNPACLCSAVWKPREPGGILILTNKYKQDQGKIDIRRIKQKKKRVCGRLVVLLDCQTWHFVSRISRGLVGMIAASVRCGWCLCHICIPVRARVCVYTCACVHATRVSLSLCTTMYRNVLQPSRMYLKAAVGHGR